MTETALQNLPWGWLVRFLLRVEMVPEEGIEPPTKGL